MKQNKDATLGKEQGGCSRRFSQWQPQGFDCALIGTGNHRGKRFNTLSIPYPNMDMGQSDRGFSHIVQKVLYA